MLKVKLFLLSTFECQTSNCFDFRHSIVKRQTVLMFDIRMSNIKRRMLNQLQCHSFFSLYINFRLKLFHITIMASASLDVLDTCSNMKSSLDVKTESSGIYPIISSYYVTLKIVLSLFTCLLYNMALQLPTAVDKYH